MAESTLRDTQYRPVSTVETAGDDALSVRFIRDGAHGINNAFSRACAPVYADAWPASSAGNGMYYSPSTTDESILLRIPRIHVGRSGHYNFATWSACAYIGASSNDATLRLYASKRRYAGPDLITTAWKEQLERYDSDDQTIDAPYGTDYDVVDSVESLAIYPDERGDVYFMLGALFASASGSNIVVVLSLTITLAHVTADIL